MRRPAEESEPGVPPSEDVAPPGQEDLEREAGQGMSMIGFEYAFTRAFKR